MVSQKLGVLLVPGLYPRGCQALQHLIYKSVMPMWQADGYNLVVHQFGWDNKLPLAKRQQALYARIDNMPDTTYAIGASAGGLAVINALRESNKLRKVITIASPLNLTEDDLVGFKNNPLVPIPTFLREAYWQADTFLNTTSTQQRAKIVSIFGKDTLVLPQWSQRPIFKHYELPVAGHGKIIRCALTKYRHKIQKLLTD